MDASVIGRVDVQPVAGAGTRARDGAEEPAQVLRQRESLRKVRRPQPHAVVAAAQPAGFAAGIVGGRGDQVEGVLEPVPGQGRGGLQGREHRPLPHHAVATELGRDRVQDAASRGPVGAGELELGDRVGADGRVAAQCHRLIGASGGNQGTGEHPIGQGAGATQPPAVSLHLLDRHVHAAVEMPGGHPVASASHCGLELLDVGIVRINEVRAADSGQEDRAEGAGPVAAGSDHRRQLTGAVAAGRDQDPSAPEGASADLKEEERAVWLVVLNLVNEALDGGQALAQPDRLDIVDGLGRGTSEVSGDRLRQHDVECGGARIEGVLFHRCLGTSR